jgi:hypothetical protein
MDRESERTMRVITKVGSLRRCSMDGFVSWK